MILEFTYRFEAAHRFLNTESTPCMTPHGHTWYATLGLEYLGKNLNANQMTQEFATLKGQWKTLITETLDHSYLHNINDPIIEVLQKESNPRLLPFPGDPTTESIALLLFNKMNLLFQSNQSQSNFQVSFIKIQETPTNSITCGREFYNTQKNNINLIKGWWTEAPLNSRTYHGSNL